MKGLTLQDVRQAVAGKSLTALLPNGPLITAVCTDSRRMLPYSLFVAIRGDKFDGHGYLHDAAKAGATAAIVDHMPVNPPEGMALIEAANTRAALGKLARRVRQDLRGRVIAVAGSNGKTSTKYLIHSALANRFKGSISPKSYNNDIGVPLTLFMAEPSHDYVVLEMGTNHPGEIQNLTEMAKPDIAVITNAGAEHLEFLGDLAGVRRENGTIIWGLNKEKGLLIVNGDDRGLLEAVSQWRGQRITFGFERTNDLFATDVVCDQTGVRFKLNGSRKEIFVPLLGKHTAANALAAIAVARKMGVTEEQTVENLARAKGPEMRLQLQRRNGMTLLNDAYNANPNSMKAALETLSTIPNEGRRIAILGDMLEMGKTSDEVHREVGEFAAGCKVDLLVCVGPAASHIAEAAKENGLSDAKVSQYPDAPAAAAALHGTFKDGDLILLKASRGIRLEQVAGAIG